MNSKQEAAGTGPSQIELCFGAEFSGASDSVVVVSYNQTPRLASVHSLTLARQSARAEKVGDSLKRVLAFAETLAW